MVQGMDLGKSHTLSHFEGPKPCPGRGCLLQVLQVPDTKTNASQTIAMIAKGDTVAVYDLQVVPSISPSLGNVHFSAHGISVRVKDVQVH